LKRILLIFSLISIIIISLIFFNREIKGCMDPTAFNYNPKANAPDLCVPIIMGCTEEDAINYNSKANVMLDSSCIIVRINSWDNRSYNFNQSKIYIDQAKYNNVSYKFIYNISDTIRKEYESKYHNGNSYIFRYFEINKLDTITYTTAESIRMIEANSLSVISLPKSDNIKVIEDINGIERTYYINIQNKEYILNPKKYYKYRFETAKYGSLAFSFGAEDVSYGKGFCVEIEDDIDFWFKDFPSQITVTESTKYGISSSLRTYSRNNITRYR